MENESTTLPAPRPPSGGPSRSADHSVTREPVSFSARYQMKRCSKCGIEKPMDAFRVHIGRAFNRHSWCKECKARNDRKYYKTDDGKITKRKAAQKWYYKSENSLKHKTHERFNSAAEKGKIKRMPCSICGNPRSHGHHPDYSKPFEVIWLCYKHHKEEHRRIKLEERIRAGATGEQLSFLSEKGKVPCQDNR